MPRRPIRSLVAGLLLAMAVPSLATSIHFPVGSTRKSRGVFMPPPVSIPRGTSRPASVTSKRAMLLDSRLEA